MRSKKEVEIRKKLREQQVTSIRAELREELISERERLEINRKHNETVQIAFDKNDLNSLFQLIVGPENSVVHLLNIHNIFHCCELISSLTLTYK